MAIRHKRLCFVEHPVEPKRAVICVTDTDNGAARLGTFLVACMRRWECSVVEVQRFPATSDAPCGEVAESDVQLYLRI